MIYFYFSFYYVFLGVIKFTRNVFESKTLQKPAPDTEKQREQLRELIIKNHSQKVKKELAEINNFLNRVLDRERYNFFSNLFTFI